MATIPKFPQKLTHELTRDEADEAAANIQRIHALPAYALPEGDARAALVALAEAGHDVDAYQPAASKEWVIWCRPAEPWMEGRYSVEQWQQVWRGEYERILGSEEVAR